MNASTAGFAGLLVGATGLVLVLGAYRRARIRGWPSSAAATRSRVGLGINLLLILAGALLWRLG